MEQDIMSVKISQIIEDKDFENWIRQHKGVFRFPVYPDSEPMQDDIMAMELSVRSYNCLKRAGFSTISSLVKGINGREDLMRIRNCGAKSQREIMLSIFLYQYSKMKPEKREMYQEKVREMN